MATDASIVGIAAVLYQLNDDSRPDTDTNRRWILFVSRALHRAERNYSATRLELLAIVYGLIKPHYYVYGLPLIVLTDHRGLTFLFSQKDPSPVMTHYMDTILTYNIKQFIHLPGLMNTDHLSRIYPPRPIRLESPQQSSSAAHARFTVDALTADQRPGAIERAHLKGHFGVKATMASLIDNGHHWPGMRSDVEEHLRQCMQCQRYTVTRHGFHPLAPIRSSIPMDLVLMDCATAFPTSPRRMNILLIVIFRFHQVRFPARNTR